MKSGGNNFSRNFQDLILRFPGLSRTKVIFQDFPGPGILKKNIQDFPGGVGTLTLHVAKAYKAYTAIKIFHNYNTNHLLAASDRAAGTKHKVVSVEIETK